MAEFPAARPARAAAYLLLGAMAFGGCSSTDSAKEAQGTSGPDTAASAAPASNEAPEQAAAGDATFPVYPNAKRQPIPAGMGQVDMCGRKQSTGTRIASRTR